MPFIVKNMDIPKSCKQCIEKGLNVVINCSQWKYITPKGTTIFRAATCPLVDVKEDEDNQNRWVDVWVST